MIEDDVKQTIDDIGVYSCDIDVQNVRTIKYTTDIQIAVVGFKIASTDLSVFEASWTKAQKINGKDKGE